MVAPRILPLGLAFIGSCVVVPKTVPPTLFEDEVLFESLELVLFELGVEVGVAVGVGVGSIVGVGVGSGVAVGVGLGDGSTDGVGVGDGSMDGVGVGEVFGVAVGDGVGVGLLSPGQGTSPSNKRSSSWPALVVPGLSKCPAKELSSTTMRV